jgi:hypothetical protein
MSKEQLAKRKEEILAAIKDPTVREHYRAQLDMAEEMEAEGIPTAFHDSDLFVEERKEIANEIEERVAKEAVKEVKRDFSVWLAVALIAACAAYLCWRFL